ncbi:hypothetical protein RR46_11683 [Papilio xuthus]|uniref:Uncharacterized protein n=1 Tax=Papilio xuthus TaxID=66420 RepID=A0A194PXU3_PAPXU|nr:hypothetical protein RR46_11683 [Papilio xuthus]
MYRLRKVMSRVAGARRGRDGRLQCDPSAEAPPAAPRASQLAPWRGPAQWAPLAGKMTVSVLLYLVIKHVVRPCLTRRRWGAPMGPVRIESRR